MNKKVQIGFILSMIFLSTNTFGQTQVVEPKKTNDVKKTAKTYLDLMVNVVSTNINYGDANSAMTSWGIISSRYYTRVFPCFRVVFYEKGREIKS
jgi:hypothetical protein